VWLFGQAEATGEIGQPEPARVKRDSGDDAGKVSLEVRIFKSMD